MLPAFKGHPDELTVFVQTFHTLQRSSIKTLLECLGIVSALAGDLRLKQLEIFLVVAHQEGLTMKEISVLTRQSESIVSRGVRAMTSEGDAGALAPAFGLLELLANRADRRLRHVVLTDKGQDLRRELARLMPS